MTGAPGPAHLLPPVAARAVAWILLLLFGLYVFLKAWELAPGDPTLQSYRIDFLAFWAAARLALEGQAVAAFDPVALNAAAEVGEGRAGNLLWLYPPGFLLMVAPLGALSFWAAWVTFVGISLGLYALALRAPTAAVPGAWWLALAAPALLVGCLPIGQTGALWTAGLVAALWALRDGRSAQAGLLFALLTLKPQLGPLVAVALIAGREWRALAWACGSAALLHLASTAVLGVAYWEAFLGGLNEASRRVAEGEMPIQRLVSAYGFARALGLGHGGAVALQATVSLALLIATAWLWHRRAAQDLRTAFLCVAIPLATPYAFYYEMTLAPAAAVFLARSGFGDRPWPRLLLLALWLGPVPPLYLPGLASVAAVAPPVLAVAVAICLARARPSLAEA